MLAFGRFELQPERRRLLQDGSPAAIGARAFDVLLALAERRERIVTKTELLDLAWPGLVVEENNLQVQISSLRKLLGPQVITTIPGRGYRFTAAIDNAASGSSSGAVQGSIAGGMLSAPATPFSNLPNVLPSLYGREADLQALRSLLETQRLITVVGAGGIGKSRLAQAAAHSAIGRWSDGPWIVELASLSHPGLLSNTVAQALGITMSGKGAALDELVANLANRTALLVLDNCEQLLDSVAELVQSIMRGAPNLSLLTTSQEPLHLEAEQQYRVMPLAVPSDPGASGARDFGAVALFTARARSVDPRFVLGDESLELVIDICQRLDGLPLAIELAAARVATLGLRPVRDRLDARFKLLTGGPRAALHRHQTLRAALEWSHMLLGDGERAVFRRLGVFAGGFSMELAQGVAGDARLDEWAVLNHLSALVDKSLVVAEFGDVPRYRLLESARAFALEQLEANEMADTRQRHAHAMLKLLECVDSATIDGELQSDQYAAIVGPELANLRAARAWVNGEGGDPQVAIAFAAYASSLIDYAVECVDWLLPLQQQFESGAMDPAIAARYWGAISHSNMTGHVTRALQVEAAERALSIYRATGQPRRIFSTLVSLSRHLDALGQAEGAQKALDEARGLIRPDWPVDLHYRLLLREASHARRAGRIGKALAFIHDAVRVGVTSGDWRLEAIARINLVDLLWELGPIDEAARLACELAEAFRARPVADGHVAILFANLIGILSQIGRIDAASAVAREAIPVMRRARYTCIGQWAYLFSRRGQLDTAAVLLGGSEAECIRRGTPLQENERRVVAEARTTLEAQMQPETLKRGLAAGSVVGEGEWLPLISAALAQTGEQDR